jgi:hypothetical protein
MEVGMTPDDAGPLMYVETMDAFLNQWCSTYEEARTLREAEGGYLLPFKRQFFVTVAGAIVELGLDPDDPNWKRIGWDWVRPLDSEAWELLRDKRRSVLAARKNDPAQP